MEKDNDYYPVRIKRLVVKYKDKIRSNLTVDVENVDDYTMGIIEGEKGAYNDIVIELLSLLVDGTAYFDLEKSDDDILFLN